MPRELAAFWIIFLSLKTLLMGLSYRCEPLLVVNFIADYLFKLNN